MYINTLNCILTTVQDMLGPISHTYTKESAEEGKKSRLERMWTHQRNISMEKCRQPEDVNTSQRTPTILW